MDPILQTLLSWQFVIFSMSIAAIMFVLRTFAEYLMSTWSQAAKESKLWNDLLLPILPVLLGACGAVWIRTFPYPDGLITTASRFIFGLVAGLLSTLLYRVFKALLVNKSNTPGSGFYPPIYTPPVIMNPGGYPGGIINPGVINPAGGVPPGGVFPPPGQPGQPVQPGIAQAGVVTPDNPVNPTEMDQLAAQVRQTINNQ